MNNISGSVLTLNPVTLVWDDQDRSSSANKGLHHQLFPLVLFVQTYTDHYITHSIDKSMIRLQHGADVNRISPAGCFHSV